jgi:hypothetical protein
MIIVFIGVFLLAFLIVALIARARKKKQWSRDAAEAEMVEVIGEWCRQQTAAARPARNVRRPYQMPTFPLDVSFIGEDRLTKQRKLKRR